jgi:LuxR family transcriptional regulator, maltose regulon positive regulatory protein
VNVARAEGVSLGRSRGGLEVVPSAYRTADGGSRHLLWTATALLLEAVADGAPGDPDAAALALALGLAECRADLAEAALVGEVVGLLREVTRSAPPPAEPPWPAEPLTQSETRVLRYLPTHMGAPEIAAELFLSANTVKTHLRHLYRKLGVHSRREAVQRARAFGLLAASSRRP